MKKFNLLTAAVIGFMAVAGLSSCTPEEDPLAQKPTVTLTSPGTGSTASVVSTPGGNVTVTFTAKKADKNMDKISAAVKLEGASTSTAIDLTSSSTTTDTTLTGAGKDQITLSFVYSIENAAAPGKRTITVSAVDNDGNTGTATVVITIAGAINSYNNTIGNQNSANGSFYGSSNGTVFSQSQAFANQGSVDFIYYLEAANNRFAAPNDADVQDNFTNATTGLQNWNTKNATKFKSTNLTAADFDAIADDSAIVTAADAAGNTNSGTATASSVYAFVTAAGKKGLIKVSSINGDDAQISVKVQK